jgi:hypothetical protein
MFSAFWLAHVDPELSRVLYEAGRDELFETVLTLGAFKEYPAQFPGHGDIDSGPLVLGYSISATGFAMAPARAHGDRDTFRALYRSSHLFGLAHTTPHGWRYATGFSLGNAIMLAAMTTPAPGVELSPSGRGAPPCCESDEPRSRDFGSRTAPADWHSSPGGPPAPWRAGSRSDASR